MLVLSPRLYSVRSTSTNATSKFNGRKKVRKVRYLWIRIQGTSLGVLPTLRYLGCYLKTLASLATSPLWLSQWLSASTVPSGRRVPSLPAGPFLAPSAPYQISRRARFPLRVLVALALFPSLHRDLFVCSTGGPSSSPFFPHLLLLDYYPKAAKLPPTPSTEHRT